MNDDIKEILDYLQENSKKDKATKQLVDYITNLQEQLHQASLDIQELTERDIECPSWCNKLTNLQQENLSLAKENEQEKQFIKDCGFENGQQLVLDYIGIRQEKEDYKSRIEKAVEYIEKELKTDFDTCYYDILMRNKRHLLNILNGRSDE